MKKYKFKDDVKVPVTICDTTLNFINKHVSSDSVFLGEEDKQGDILPGGDNMICFDKSWLIEIEEKTEAEEWIDKNYEDSDLHSRAYLKSAHEAGQKIGAKNERERFNGLIVSVGKFVHHMDSLNNDYISESVRTEYEKLNKKD